MELTTAFVLFSAIAIFGFLANKLIDRKYGTKPNQKILNEVESLRDKLFQNDWYQKVTQMLINLPIQQSITNQDVEQINKGFKDIHAQLEKMSARIDGQQIKKAFNLDREEVKHL